MLRKFYLNITIAEKKWEHENFFFSLFLRRLLVMIPQTLYFLLFALGLHWYQKLLYFCQFIFGIGKILQNYCFLLAYNVIIYRREISRNEGKTLWPTITQNYRNFRIITFSQLWLYLGKTFLAHFVRHNTDYKTIWLIFLISISISVILISAEKNVFFFFVLEFWEYPASYWNRN